MNNPSATKHDHLDSLLGEVADDYLQQLARGKQPEIEQYADEHPEIARLIRQTFPALKIVSDSLTENNRGEGLDLSQSKQLGDFRLLRELGSGGMGFVYEAEQISMGRRVALKILPMVGALQQKQLQRFRNEVRAAAMLDHPHIVSVYSVGEDRGVHYYAMRLIRGQSLAEVIAELRQLHRGNEALTGESIHQALSSAASQSPSPSSSAYAPTEEYLPQTDGSGDSASDTQPSVKAQITTDPEFSTDRGFFRSAALLGIQAAEALQHAHDLGVLHRDIKPGNLMLDAEAQLHVTDFGLARIESDAGMTMTGDLVGTLRYMAPEQALAKRMMVDNRADVYSLGVTLYELLTLRPTYDGSDRETLIRQIAFDEPRSPRYFNRAVPIDLETIVLKAISKNPHERYSTAGEMAEDLQRFLEDRTIQARRPTVFQRTAKWSRRYRALLSTVAVTVVIAWAAASVVIFDAMRKEQVAKIQAQTNLKETRQSIDNYVDTIQNAELLREERFKPLLKELLKDARTHYERFVEKHGDDPSVHLELAESFDRLGHINHAQGDTGEAIANHQSAANLWQALAQQDDTVTAYRNGLAHCLNRLARCQIDTARFKEAQSALHHAGEIWERLAQEEPAIATHRSNLAGVNSNLVLIYNKTGQRDRALAAIEKAIRVQRSVVADFPDVAAYSDYLATHLAHLADSLKAHRDATSAIEALRESVAIRKRLVKGNPTSLSYLSGLSSGYRQLGTIYANTGNAEEALTAYEDSRRICAELVRLRPTNRVFREEYAKVLRSLGNHYQSKGELPEAVAAYENSRELWLQLHNEQPNVTAIQEGLASCLSQLLIAYIHVERVEDAVEAYEQGLPVIERLADSNPNVVEWQSDLAGFHTNGALVQYSAGHIQEALAAQDSSRIAFQRLTAREPNVIGYAIHLAGSHINSGNIQSEVGQLAESLASFKAGIGALHAALKIDAGHATAKRFLRNAHWLRAESLARLQRHEEAIADWERAVELDTGGFPTAIDAYAWYLVSTAPPGPRDSARAVTLAEQAVARTPRDGGFWRTLGVAKFRVGDSEAALQSLTKAIELTQGGDAVQYLFLAMANWELGDKDQSKTWYDKAMALTKEDASEDEELQRFRREAATLLGEYQPDEEKGAELPGIEIEDKTNEAPTVKSKPPTESKDPNEN